ncbi:hypothetical protein [Belliella aquatica]|uniref:hypothetical protein n=1 Tax=Belliella aquatica TaxID=1323734 RepID=UPI00166456B0|nr:hypothetical protein [Belliella aquatica]MCH7407299.1 hypothetical protein [Belliella aquatica]
MEEGVKGFERMKAKGKKRLRFIMVKRFMVKCKIVKKVFLVALWRGWDEVEPSDDYGRYEN